MHIYEEFEALPSFPADVTLSFGRFDQVAPFLAPGTLVLTKAPREPPYAGLKDTVPERPYHSNFCTSEFH